MAIASKSHLLWSVLLTFTIVVIITICIYISSPVEKQEFSSRSVKQGSLLPEMLTDENCIPTCDSKECVMQAKLLLSYMDSSVNPCENADLFMCGEYEKRFSPDEYHDNEIAKEKLLNELRDILDNIQPEPGTPSWKLKTVYDSCTNIGSSELKGITHFQKFLKNELGITNWPYLDADFRFADLRISKLLGHTKSLSEFYIFLIEKQEGENYTYTVDFVGDNVNETTNILTEGEVHALKYFDLAQENIEIILSDIQDVQSSIAELNSNLKHTECKENCTYVYVNCSNLIDEEWTLLCETVEAYDNEIAKFSGKERRDAIVIKLWEEILLKNLFSLLDSLPDRSVANFFAFKFLCKFLEEINFYFRLTKMKFDSSEETPSPIPNFQPDLWKNCMKWITFNMKLSLGKEFFRHYMKTSIMDEVSDFYNEFKSDIKKMIELQEWISPERKSLILSWVANLTLNLHIIKNVVENNTFLNDHYEMFHPTTESFFDNVLQYQKIHEYRSSLPHLGLGDDDQTEYALFFNVFESNAGSYPNRLPTLSQFAAYDGIVLQIGLDYGMLFPPYYTPNVKSDVNRLVLAWTIGHEIGHYLNYFLGTPIRNRTDVPPEFLEAEQCIDNQFSEFEFDILKKNLNAAKISEDNKADYFGTVLVDKILDEYDAPQNQFLLPGLDYSTKQLLYISTFQTFCVKENLASQKFDHEKEIHAPGKFRIIGSSQNSQSYSNLFQCPDGSSMNPKKKCSLLSGI